jgi:hypothetical protein
MTSSKSTKKTTKKNKSKPFDVRTIQGATEQLKEALKTYNDKYLQQPWKNWKGFMEDAVKDPSGTVSDFVDDGKNFVMVMKKDLHKTLGGFLKSSKNIIKDKSMIKTVEKKISNKLKAFPARINLASKQDIEKLCKTMDALNKKVDKINKGRAS